MTTFPHEQAPSPKLPVAIVGMLLVAFGALYWVKGGTPLLPLLGLAVCATYVIPLRMEAESVRWLVRFLLFALALGASFLSSGSEYDGLLDPRWTNILGYLCAAELTVQAWSRRPSLAALFMLPAFVFLAAGNTYHVHKLPYLAPAFMLLLMLSLPYYRPRPFRLGAGMALVTGAALGLTLGAGCWLNRLVNTHHAEIYRWGDRFLTPREGRTVGLSLEPRLGRTFGLRGSPRRIMRLSGYRGDGYWRGIAFDRYERGRWLPTVQTRTLASLPAELLPPAVTAPSVQVGKYEKLENLLFVPLDTAGIRVNASVVWSGQDGGPLISNDPELRRYELVPAAPGGSVFWPPPAAAQRQRLLHVPGEIDPGVRELADTIGEGRHTTQEKIQAVTAYLATHHAYSLTTNPGAGDPISSFLLQRKDAHCEYFAAAAVILLRCLDVPARYVVGYYAHETAADGATVVRQRDAHAWAECWADGVGWVTVDATPGDGRPDRSPEHQPSWWLRAWEKTQDGLQHLRGWVETLTGGQVVLVLLAVMAPYFLLKIWQTRRTREAARHVAKYTAATDRELEELAARFTVWLTRAQQPCPPARPWQEHLALANGSARARDFVQLYNAVRFGAAPRDEAVPQLRALLDALEHETPVRAGDHTT